MTQLDLQAFAARIRAAQLHRAQRRDMIARLALIRRNTRSLPC